MDALQDTPLPRRVKDLVDQHFGRLVVVRFDGIHVFPRGQRTARWLCLCECGKECRVLSSELKVQKSCGCLTLEKFIARKTSHGMAHTKIYRHWKAMIKRCTNPSDSCFYLYGGQGITVCQIWRNSFESFYQDMGEPPTAKHSLDRFPDKNGNYEPGNVRWASPTEQARNKRNNHLVLHEGQEIPISELAEKVNIPAYILHGRIGLGWSVEKSIAEPVKYRTRLSPETTTKT